MELKEYIKYFQAEFDKEHKSRTISECIKQFGKPPLYVWNPAWEFEDWEKRSDYAKTIRLKISQAILSDFKFRETVSIAGYRYEILNDACDINVINDSDEQI